LSEELLYRLSLPRRLLLLLLLLWRRRRRRRLLLLLLLLLLGLLGRHGNQRKVLFLTPPDPVSLAPARGTAPTMCRTASTMTAVPPPCGALLHVQRLPIMLGCLSVVRQ
jgi:hypothetical protein